MCCSYIKLLLAIRYCQNMRINVKLYVILKSACECPEKVVVPLTFSVKCEIGVSQVTLSAFTANDFMVITSLGDGRLRPSPFPKLCTS